jgi:hypothetical protein
LLLATLGLVVLVLGPVAIVLAQREIKRVDEGKSPSAGRDFSTLARTLGVFEVLVMVVALGFWVMG